jgi:hypothetical protein
MTCCAHAIRQGGSRLGVWIRGRVETAGLRCEATTSATSHLHTDGLRRVSSLIIDIEGFVPDTTTVDAAEAVGPHVEQAVFGAVTREPRGPVGAESASFGSISRPEVPGGGPGRAPPR